MLLERIYDEDLSQTGYLIACQSTGEALVVDAGRDVRRYLDLVASHGLTISAVTETHIHADLSVGHARVGRGYRGADVRLRGGRR